MSIPLLDYAPIAQNNRVNGFEIQGEEQPHIYSTENLPSPGDFDQLIMAAYRQIYNEQQMISSNRQSLLESQLRIGQLTVRDFIRGLILSDSFRRLVYDSNNNYRFAEICIQRVLGRNVYSDREKMAWSIVIATKGIQGFVDQLLESDEYLSNFGQNTVPYHRRRIIQQQAIGEITFSHMARYGTDYRDQLPVSGTLSGIGGARLDYLRWDWQRNQPAVLGKIGQGVVWAGVAGLGLLIVAGALGL
jgi:phycobilisome rod-core linker protein